MHFLLHDVVIYHLIYASRYQPTCFTVVISVKKDTFVYIFKHRLGTVPNSRPEWVIADHGDDELIALGTPFFKPLCKIPMYEGRDNYTDEDRFVSKLLMSYWTNFAKTGYNNLFLNF